MVAWSNVTWSPSDQGPWSVDAKGLLHLGVDKETKAAGQLLSSRPFKYGSFEVEARLPRGRWLHPSFRLVPETGVAPEVAVFEGFSNSKGNYFDFLPLNPLSWWAVKSNFWAARGGGRRQFGYRQHWLLCHDPAEHYTKYKLLWTKTDLTICYDGWGVRRTESKTLLDQLARSRMHILIGNGIREDAKGAAGAAESDFVIKSFSYQPL